MTAPSPIGSQTQQWLMPAVEAVAPPAAVDDQVVELVPSVGRLQRWQLTEPVRLWVYGVLLVVTVGLQMIGWLSGDWADYVAGNAGIVLGVGALGEGIRQSVYSPAGVIRAARAAAEAVR